MPITIQNQANLAYKSDGNDTTAVSNIATTTLQGPLTILIDTIENTCGRDNEITFMLTVTNSGITPLSDVQIIDSLCTYSYKPSPSDPEILVTPLDYEGTSCLYLNGIYNSNLTPTPIPNGIVYTLNNLAAGTTALIIHKARTNKYATLRSNQSMTDTLTVGATGLSETLTDSCSIDAENIAKVQIFKFMTPDPVLEGASLNYNFVLHNYGNIEATDVVLTDTFDPDPATPLVIKVNGTTIPDTDYDYDTGTLTLPNATATTNITVPPATITQDDSGVVSVVPGETKITVTGTI